MPIKDQLPASEPGLGSAQALRQRAEETLHRKAAAFPHSQAVLSPEATRQMLHELRVHQIELEMQNNELRQAQLALDTSRARYFDLYDLAPVGYCTLSEQGLIIEGNQCAAALLGVARGTLARQPFSRFISPQEAENFYLLRKLLLSAGVPQARDLRMVKNDGTPFWAHLEASAARDDAGAPILRIVISDIGERKQAEEKLNEMAAGLEATVNQRTSQLRSVTAQLMFSEERERRLLAQNLHDNLSQMLAVIKIELTTLEASGLQSAVEHIVGLVDLADRDVRRIAMELSPPILRMLGLMPTFQWLAEEIQRQYRLAVHIAIEGNPKPLGDEVQAMLFRSVRELLINAAKHAASSEASLCCLCEGSRLTLVVSDNGCGFDPAEALDSQSDTPGFGLRSMHERIVNIGGKMEIDSRPGNGSKITLSVPYDVPLQQRRRHDPGSSAR